MSDNINEQPESSSLQDYLSLGYIYLLVLGISHEMIFYGFLDINILSYSSVIDVLLSPLVYLGGNLKTFGFLIGIGISLFYLMPYIEKMQKKTKKEGQLEFKGSGAALFLFALMLSGFFVGTGLAGGHKINNKIKSGDFKLTHELTFSDGRKIIVRKIRNNSQYFFYVEKDATQISISPISGNIKKIEKIEEVEIKAKK